MRYWLSGVFLRLASLCGARVEVRRPPARDARGRFLRDTPYAAGPAESLGLHPKLNEVSKVRFEACAVNSHMPGGNPTEITTLANSGPGAGPGGLCSPTRPDQATLDSRESSKSLEQESLAPQEHLEGELYRLQLRRWIVRNMDDWINHRHANVGMVFRALERSESFGYGRNTIVGVAPARPSSMSPASTTGVLAPEGSVKEPFSSVISAGEGRAGATPTVHPTSPVPTRRFDPTYDVVAHLPPDVLKRTSDGVRCGFGNDAYAAIADYLRKQREDCGPGYPEYALNPRVYEDFDENDYPYYIAMPEGKELQPKYIDGTWRDKLLYEDNGDVVEEPVGTGPALSAVGATPASPADFATLAAADHLAIGPLATAAALNHNVVSPNGTVDPYHRDTETLTDEKTLNSSSSMARWLGGESRLIVEGNTEVGCTTVGGDKLRPYAVSTVMPNAKREPSTVNREADNALEALAPELDAAPRFSDLRQLIGPAGAPTRTISPQPLAVSHRVRPP